MFKYQTTNGEFKFESTNEGLTGIIVDGEKIVSETKAKNLVQARRDYLRRNPGAAVAVGVHEVLDVKIPQITIPVAPGRNLAVLVEAAVRSHMLKSQGIDQARIFMDRQAARLQRQPG